MATANEAVQHQLRTATLRILRAHDFTRTSGSAVSILVDLVSRFFDLLATATAEHAQFAGRNSANLYDVLEAFDELGIDLHETIQWSRRDGPALAQYTVPQAPPELAEVLHTGIPVSSEKPLVLEYRQVDDSEDEEDTPSPGSTVLASPTLINSTIDWEMDNTPSSEPQSPSSDAFSPGPSASLYLPNMGAWNAMVANHTHDHLPPFPGDADADTEMHDAEEMASPEGSRSSPTKVTFEPAAPPKRRAATNRAKTPAQMPLYDEPLPFEGSTSGQELFTQLPDAPRREETVPPPPTHPFLLIAMQTAHESLNSGSNNPSRLAISSTLSAAATSRYTSSDSLFSSSAPPPPRSLAPAPSHPIPQSGAVVTMLLPPPQPRSIQSPLADSLDPQPPHLHTHMHALADRVVKPGVQERSTLLAPPPAFVDPINQTPYLYGRAARAPWNKQANQQVQKDRPSGLTDALLFNTWATVQKLPDEELKGKG